MSAALQLNNTDWLNVDRELSKRSFAEFLKLAWPAIDPEDYLHNWHMDALGEHLQAIATQDLNRLLINVPPGTSKSSAASVFFPAWLWGPGGKPHWRYVGASHESTLATRDNLRTRRLITSEWYQERWPIKLTSDQNEKTYFENDKFGFRQSGAVRSTTGKRGHVVTWDDPLNPESANSETDRETANRIMSETLPSRMVDPRNSAIVVIMQRLHVEDVAGRILADNLGYEHLMLPMEFERERRCYTVVCPKHIHSEPETGRYIADKQIWVIDGKEYPAEVLEMAEGLEKRTVYNQDPREEDGELLFEKRFPKFVVDRDNKAMGSYAAAGQQQQRPVPRGGGLFKRHWFRPVKAVVAGTQWMRGWDFAGTKVKPGANPGSGPAYSAGVLIGKQPDGRFIIADCARLRGSPNEVERLLVNTAFADGAGVKGSIPQDPGQAGKMQVQYWIGLLAGLSYTSSPESGDKVTRAEGLAAQAEAGNVDILIGPWNKPYLDELEMFPFGAFADQADASSRAFGELVNVKQYNAGTVRFPI